MLLLRLTLVLVGSLIMGGCGTQATATSVLLSTDVPTDVPTINVESADSETTNDVESTGQVLFEQFYEEAGFACETCHYVQTDNRLLGPGLLSVDSRFETYDSDVDDIESYIRQSILEPVTFISPDDPPFPENIMPQNYADIFSESDIDAIIEYVLSF